MLNISKHFESKPHSASLRFPKGLGLIVTDEIEEIIKNIYTPLKFTPKITATTSSVSIENASVNTLAEICMRTKTCKDIILQLGSTRIMQKSEIKKLVEKTKWQLILPEGAKIALRVSTSNSKLYHSGLIEEAFYNALTTQGLIIGDKKNCLCTLDLNLKNNFLNLGISLAGAKLNQRGYRRELSHLAPLNECIAACCVRMNSTQATDIHIPFAGSGTFGFEALLNFAQIAPCLFRTYALESLPFISNAMLKHTRTKAKKAVALENFKLLFSDNDINALEKLKTHVKSFQEIFKANIEIEKADFFTLEPEIRRDKEICLFLNPPYGERLKSSEKFFKKLALRLNSIYSTHDAKVWGVCLMPAGDSANLFKKNLQALKTESVIFSNGGLATEAVAFLFTE